MHYFQIVFDACYSILNYDFHIFGFQFSLMNFAVWCVLAYFLLRFIHGIFR